MGIGPYRLFETITRFANVLSELDDAGIRIEVGDDFQRYRHYRAQCVDRKPVYPMFDVESSYIDHTNGFWVCGFEPGGEVIHTQAVRLLNLQSGTLDQHLKTHRHKYIAPDSTPDPDRTVFVGPRALGVVTGEVGYHGDFWVRSKGLGGPRSQGATAILSRMLLEIVELAWQPSYVFAFVPKRLAVKGTHLRYGYVHCEPGRWIGPDEQITDEDHLIWMDAGDLSAMCAEAPPTMRAQTLPRPKDAEPARREGLSVVEPAVRA